jgi:hypothetical protein
LQGSWVSVINQKVSAKNIEEICMKEHQKLFVAGIKNFATAFKRQNNRTTFEG